jgi:hypothetical protein
MMIKTILKNKGDAVVTLGVFESDLAVAVR